MLDESLRFEIATLQNTEAKSELGSADDGQPPEIDSHLNRLLNLWKRLKSITDRASDVKSRSLARSQDFELLAIAALREAEYADLIEQSMMPPELPPPLDGRLSSDESQNDRPAVQLASGRSSHLAPAEASK